MKILTAILSIMLTLALLSIVLLITVYHHDTIAQAIESIIRDVTPDWAVYHIVVKVDHTTTFDEFCNKRVYALGNVICTQPQGIIVYHIPDGAHITDKRGQK